MTRKSTRTRRLFPALPKVAKNNLLDSLGVTAVNYKDTARLRMFISERGKIRSRDVTGLTVQQQRQVAPRSRTRAKWRYCPTRDKPLTVDTRSHLQKGFTNDTTRL